MIQISRRNIRAIRATIRQSLGITSARRAPPITLRATANQLLIQAATEKTAIEFCLPGNYQPESFSIPYDGFTVCEGKQDEPVSFTRRDDTVLLQWTDSGIPQSSSYSATDPIEMPPIPENLVTLDSRFLSAMAAAVATTDKEATRHALNCIRLRGRDGQIAATDSCQALVQTGYSFPWTDDVLIAASEAFTSSAFSEADNVRIGSSADWVTVQVNSGTLHLRIEKERRFPNIDLQIPTQGTAATTLSLSDDDVEFLLTSTKRLPGAEDACSPVTVELNGVVAVRAASESRETVMELVLSNSHRRGAEVLFNTNREFLCRAAQLGFRDIQLRSNAAPAYCQDDRRIYLWALLDEESVIRASQDAIRICSPLVSESSTRSKGSSSTMINTPSSRSGTADVSRVASARSAIAKPADAPQAGVSQESAPQSGTSSSDSDNSPNLLTQAETLRDSLSKALSETRDLISLIKRNQKQNRLVETTLRSLKQLEHIGA